MTKLLFLSGSIRKDSLNKKLAKTAVEIAKKIGGAEITYVDLVEFDMPIYNGDFEAENGLPENAKRLKKLFVESDGFFIASPEYNSLPTPLLKNALDWVSRKEPEDAGALLAFNGKVVALTAASMGGLGGVRGLVGLRAMFANNGAFVIPQQMTIPAAHNEFDAEGKLAEKHVKPLQGVVEQLVMVAGKLKK